MSENLKKVLVVLGMHRSGTSAISGTFVRLGITPPARLIQAEPMNARGFYESEAITGFNEELLGHLGTTWFDANLLKEGWADSLDPTWYKRAAETLNTEYGEADIALMKDPRMCRLLPFWLRVFQEQNREPVFICIHRPPVEVAGSLRKWANYSLEYGELLWLRYVLEAEKNSRTQKRAFVSYASLMEDWEGVTERLADNVGIELDMSEETHEAVDSFLSPSLKHIDRGKSGHAATIPQTEAIFEVLERWSASGEDAQGRAVFDLHLARMNDLVPLLIPVLTTALDRFNKIERMRAAEKELQTLLESARTEINTQSDTLKQIMSERTDFANQLAHLRRKPLDAWGDLWTYKILKRLSADKSPLPPRMKARMARSAFKRHPARSLPGQHAIAAADSGLAMGEQLTPESDDGTKKGMLAYRPDLPNILVVSHDASWTGAPILAQNLARTYNDRYNVTVLCLRGGNLLPAFQDVATTVEIMPIGGKLKGRAKSRLEAFLLKGNFEFAIVNSIESRHVLKSTRALGIPTVSLVHEFASYTLPRTAFPDTIDNADTVVFSTKVTFDNAIDVTGVGFNPKVKILPQGKCSVPSKSRDSSPDQAERDRLQSILRPKGKNEETLVIGAGTVQIRKGTDLFIEVARKTLSQPDGKNYRFVWFGGGYAPDSDTGYSVYLEDQIKRAGVEDRVLIQPVTSEIEYVYELADVFLLTSRLDPLPNVAIDSMLVGLPVIGFQNASGVPEILRKAGLEAECVADYIDTTQMSEKLLRLNGSELERVSAAVKDHALETFDFATYAGQIETWALDTAKQKDAREDTLDLIAADSGFAPEFMMPLFENSGYRRADAKTYLDKYALGIHARRPEPGFNQQVYLAHQPADSPLMTDAYADYIKNGRPAGPWKTEILQGPVSDDIAVAPTDLRTALHIHAYYVENLAEIVTRLKLNRNRPALFVSVKDAQGQAKAETVLAEYEGLTTIRILRNVGRDIGPFLTEFGPKMVGEFDVIGHVHTKKSLAIKDAASASAWKHFVLENMLGGQIGGAMMDLQLREFERDPKLGLSFPADPYVMSWSKNRPHAAKLAARLGIEDLPNAFDFPIGTMFWIRAEALLPFVELGLEWSDFPAEPLPYDGSMLHALERLFGVIPFQNGYGIKMTNVKGVTR